MPVGLTCTEKFFFSRTPLLRTLAIRDTKSPPAPLPPPLPLGKALGTRYEVEPFPLDLVKPSCSITQSVFLFSFLFVCFCLG